MSKEFWDWFSDGDDGGYTEYSTDDILSAWNASEEATEKRVLDDVIEMAKKHTEAFIKELKEKFGLK